MFDVNKYYLTSLDLSSDVLFISFCCSSDTDTDTDYYYYYYYDYYYNDGKGILKRLSGETLKTTGQ